MDLRSRFAKPASLTPQVRALAMEKLMLIRQQYAHDGIPRSPEQAHGALLAADITGFLERPYEADQRPALPDAPGSPTGGW